MISYYTIILVAVLIGLYVLHMVIKTPKAGGEGLPIVYGSMKCPHTVKLRETIGNHDFYDCDSKTCPEFVEASQQPCTLMDQRG